MWIYSLFSSTQPLGWGREGSALHYKDRKSGISVLRTVSLYPQGLVNRLFEVLLRTIKLLYLLYVRALERTGNEEELKRTCVRDQERVWDVILKPRAWFPECSRGSKWPSVQGQCTDVGQRKMARASSTAAG